MDDDSQLAQAAARGDAAAFAALVRLHEVKVRRFLARLSGGQDADDLAQEVFIKAWRMRGAWRGEGSYGGWLMRIAWTGFLSDRRSATRRQARDQQAYEPGEQRQAQQPELRIDVADALAALDERERAAAMLCFAEGYSHSEAAGIMDLPLGTLKSIVARARARLVASLEMRND